ncbi:hypothetical protein ACEPAF_3051 [Sanghuangporus sanghuang]
MNMLRGRHQNLRGPGLGRDINPALLYSLNSPYPRKSTSSSRKPLAVLRFASRLSSNHAESTHPAHSFPPLLELTSTFQSSSTASSSSWRLSRLPGFRPSLDSDMKRNSSDSSQFTLSSTSSNYAEDLDDDNMSWGPVSRKKKQL